MHDEFNPPAVESTGWYHDVFENNWAVKLLIDPQDGRIVDANPAACTFYGYDRETFRTLRITDINLLAHDQVHEQMGKACEGTQRLFDFPHRLADGDIRWVQVHSGPLQIEGRTLLFSIIHDITPLEKARVALNESEAHYRALVESSEDVIFQVDRHGRFAFINAAGARLLGRPKDDILNHGFSELLDEDTARIACRLLEKVIRTGLSATAETNLDTDDRTVPLSTRLTPIKGDDNRVMWAVGIAREVPERGAGAESDTGQVFDALTEIAREPMFHTDAQGRLVWTNPAFCRLFGSRPDDLAGRRLVELTPETEAVELALQRLQSPPYQSRHRAPFRCAGGTCEMTWRYRALVDTDGRVTGFVGVGSPGEQPPESNEGMA